MSTLKKLLYDVYLHFNEVHLMTFTSQYNIWGTINAPTQLTCGECATVDTS